MRASCGRTSGGSGVNIGSEQCTVQGETRSMNHEKAVVIIDSVFKIRNIIVFWNISGYEES